VSFVAATLIIQVGETGIIWLGMSRVVVRGALSGQTYPHSSPHVCGASLPRTLRETWRGSTKLAMVGGSCEDSFLGILDGLKRAMIGSSRRANVVPEGLFLVLDTWRVPHY